MAQIRAYEKAPRTAPGGDDGKIITRFLSAVNDMNHLRRHVLSIALGGLLVAALVGLGLARPLPAVDPLAWLLFAALFVFTDTFSIPIGVGFVSLSATAAVGVLLIMGPWAAAWAGLAGSLVNVGLRVALPGRLGAASDSEGWLALLGVGMINAVMLSLSLFGGAALYQAAGGRIPLTSLDPVNLGPYLLLILGFAVVNYSLAGGYLFLRNGPAALRGYLQVLPNAVLFEMLPQLFTPLLPLIYLVLGPAPFMLFAVGLGGASLVIRRLAVTGHRLEQRVAEMKTLGALSQGLAASLQIEGLLAILREQLPGLLPASGQFVALWDPETDVLKFPLAMENGRSLSWETRRSVNGLSEYVVRTRRPLLLPDSVNARAAALGLTPPTAPAASWLAVPIIAGSQVLGALGMYTLVTQPQPLTDADRDLLVAIASQLAVALNNARLYERTDEALAQRVQQLSSILFTTAEGILLLDAETRVLTANRALESFVGLPASGLSGRLLATDDDLLARLGTTAADLRVDLADLPDGSDLVKHLYTTGGAGPRDLERTLAPVRAGTGGVTGWLMILRDVTEEQALGRLRDDLTHMLIHDLRGPLSSILTSLQLMQEMTPAGKPLEPDMQDVLKLARGSGQRLLEMINALLDIARMESGAVPLQCEAVSPEELLSGAIERLRPAANAASLRLVPDVAPGLPELSVDVPLIGRVLDNLGDNAVKFSPNGAAVRFWAQASATPPGVLFGVSDQGPGIPAEAQNHLFEKFHHLPNAQGRRMGTGLGLAFCRMAVEAHGGEIWVESAVGKGSTFVVRLPMPHGMREPIGNN